jgi:hypothetical protein
MAERWKKVLPVVAVVAAVATLSMVLLVGPWLGGKALRTDTGETKRAVEAVLVPVLALHPASIEDAGFRTEAVRANDATYVAYVWLFAPDGRIVEGNQAAARDTAAESATKEMRRVLGTLPHGALSEAQRTALLAASAMGREGEHNDVFRHMLREVRGPEGELVGWIGVTYDVSPAMGDPGIGYIAFVLLLLLSTSVYWLSLPAWVWMDARARGERAWTWAVFLLVGNLVALIAYILVRAPGPSARRVAGGAA